MDKNEIFSALLSWLINWVKTVGVRIAIAILLWLITFRIINRIAKKIQSSAERRKFDKTIARTLAYIFRLGGKLLVSVCLVGYVGIDTSGIAALIVSFGAGIGLALNGALSNLAGGIIIILTRPFRVDDFIEAEGYSGTVEDIHIITTKIRTPDNKVVYIPNGVLSAETVVNYSVKDTRRVDLRFSIGYNENFERAKSIILKVCNAHPLVLDDPLPMVCMAEHMESSISIVTRVWVKSEDYWTVNFDLIENVTREFDKAGIVIPYNQLDVHLKSEEN